MTLRKGANFYSLDKCERANADQLNELLIKIYFEGSDQSLKNCLTYYNL